MLDKFYAYVGACVRAEYRRIYRALAMNPYGRWYVYFRRAAPGEAFGEIVFAEDLPGEGWELGMPERVSPAWTEDYCASRICDAARQWPILGQE